MDLFILLNAHLHFTMRRYFSAQKFSHLQPPQAVQAGTNLQKRSAKSKDCGAPLLVGNLPNPECSASEDAGCAFVPNAEWRTVNR